MTVLRRVARNVFDLARAIQFYEMLGFAAGAAREDEALAAALGVEHVLSCRLRFGSQILELTQCVPQGAAYPADAHANDILFQHIALLTDDIFDACARALNAGATAISVDGPQKLPKDAGGVTAWKFRDPEGHPLEFLQMADSMVARAGYDHCAICVADAARSISFYEELGLTLKHRHVNHGVEQARLDGLAVSTVEVVAMIPEAAPPHVELLGYGGGMPMVAQLHDIAADRLVFSRKGAQLSLRRDPDGHILLFDGRD